MSLNLKIAKEIQDFVYAQPRTIQDIARLTGKNWRTADSYVSQIMNEYGTLSTKIFRGGTRGALKVVYWANIEGVNASSAQEILFNQIKRGRYKEDFEPFDVFFYCNEKQRNFLLNPAGKISCKSSYELLESAKQRLLSFSGNLSWINFKHKKRFIEVLPRLADRGVSIKILARIDLASMKNIMQVIKINRDFGQDVIEIRHMHQPLRGFIVDGNKAHLKEEKKSLRYKEKELEKDTVIFYFLSDQLWVSWLEKVFWHLFSNAMPAEKRIEQLKLIHETSLSL